MRVYQTAFLGNTWIETEVHLIESKNANMGITPEEMYWAKLNLCLADISFYYPDTETEKICVVGLKSGKEMLVKISREELESMQREGYKDPRLPI